MVVLLLKTHVIKNCEKVYERSSKNLFWSIKNPGEVLDTLKAAESVTFDLLIFEIMFLFFKNTVKN